MMRTPGPMIVFCDVDGILFDRRTGSFEEAADGIDALDCCEIPLVLCSANTRAELEHVQREIGIYGPFICEHGAALFVPDGHFSFDIPDARFVDGYQVIEFGRPYREVVDALHTIARDERIEVVGFSDMSEEQVAARYGMTRAEAARAKRREYEEPFAIAGNRARARERLAARLRQANLACRVGERLDYAGAAVDIAQPVRVLRRLYEHALGPFTSIGFGISEDDGPLLRSVDAGFMITDSPAGAGWSAAIQQIVRR